MDIEDQLPPLLRAAADQQPDAPSLFDAVTARVRRRQRRRRTGFAGTAAIAVVAAAVAVPAAGWSHPPKGEQRIVTASPGPAPTPPPPPPPVRCPATTRPLLIGRQPGAPTTQLFPDGATALTVCSWTYKHTGRTDAQRLASDRPVPAGQVAAELAALNTLPQESFFLDCLRAAPPLLLSLVARYPTSRTFTVQLVRPCSIYLTNGTFNTMATAPLIAALETGQPVTPVPSGILTVHLRPAQGSPPGAPLPVSYDIGVTQGRNFVASLPRGRDGSYTARVPAGTYTLQANVGPSRTQICTGRATVTAGNTTTVAVTCPTPHR